MTALFGVISTLGFLAFDAPRSTTNVQIDVTRVASNVAVGIGFLGAGVIFRSGNSVRNLTTAASLWAVAAIGLACGIGLVGTAAVTAVILLVSLVLLRPLRDVVRRRYARTGLALRIHLAPDVDPEAFVQELRDGGDVRLTDSYFEKEAGHVVVSVTLNAHPDEVRRRMSRLACRPDVETLAQA